MEELKEMMEEVIARLDEIAEGLFNLNESVNVLIQYSRGTKQPVDDDNEDCDDNYEDDDNET